LLFCHFTLPHGSNDVWLVPWVLAPVLGPMVFQLIARPRPKLRYGLALAGLLAIVLGVWAATDVPFKDPGTWPTDQRVAIGFYFFFLTLVAGAVGAMVAVLLARTIGPGRAWQAGVAIVALDVIAAAILTVALR
jgi:hypothetical protein